MNILVDQLRKIVSAHKNDGLILNPNFSAENNAWFVSAEVGSCTFTLASQRRPIRLFKSIDTASLYIMEEIGSDRFMVNWVK